MFCIQFIGSQQKAPQPFLRFSNIFFPAYDPPLYFPSLIHRSSALGRTTSLRILLDTLVLGLHRMPFQFLVQCPNRFFGIFFTFKDSLSQLPQFLDSRFTCFGNSFIQFPDIESPDNVDLIAGRIEERKTGRQGAHDCRKWVVHYCRKRVAHLCRKSLVHYRV